MSAPNFNSHQLGFPLYVRGDFYSKVCPDCGTWNSGVSDVCECCGEDLHDADLVYDEYDNDFYYHEAQEDLQELNAELEFFRVSLPSGYYTGTQFDVDWKPISVYGVAGDPEDLDNDDAHYYFDCCRSEMLKRYKRERRKLAKRLAELAEHHGYECIQCVGVFSNGEAVYERVPKVARKRYGYRAKVAVGASVGV